MPLTAFGLAPHPVAGPPVLGYTAWIDPSDTSTITQSSNAVSQINDKSGNGHNLTQGTGANQPLTNTDTINALNVLKFNSANFTLLSAAFTLAQPLTIVSVIKLLGTGARHDIIYGGGSNPGIFTFLQTADVWQWYAGSGINQTGIATDTSVHFVAYVYNGASSSIQVDGTVNPSSGNPGSNNDSQIGMGPNGSGFSANADIGETLWYPSALSGANISSLRTYYQGKWATP